MDKLEKTFVLLRKFLNDPNQKYILVHEESKEGRRQIHSWCSENLLESRSEYKSYRDRVKAVECDHCGHMEDYTNPDCDCGFDGYDYHFTCSVCYEETYWDSDSPSVDVKWTKKAIPTGHMIVMKEIVYGFKGMTPTPEGTWKKPYIIS